MLRGAFNIRGPTLIAALAITTTLVPVMRADLVSFDLGTPLNNDGTPSGLPPWLRATFKDVTGGVELYMESLLNGPTEFVTAWHFNVDPFTVLTISPVSGVEASSIGTGYVKQGQNWVYKPDQYKADGDGYYDILFRFPTSGSGLFKAGSDSKYLITGTGITAASFNELSQPGGGEGIWHTAAHIQGLAGGGSAWVRDGTPSPPPPPIPGPGAALLAGIGLALVGWVKRRLA